MKISPELEKQAINTIRFLSADAIQKAKSGHPGLPMGTASIAYTLWTKHLRHNPNDPKWPDRDRFVLSGGHGSMLLYSMLFLTGYNLSLEDIKNFRQWGSLTPGHPENALTPGVETTTGPLGQGFANGIGMAIAEAHLAATFNRPGYPIVNHHIYAIVTDGDLMEGVASEAASLAGHLKLGKLIYIYDDNRISIDGSTELTFTEDRAARFEAYGWHVQKVSDGNDVEAIDAAIFSAKADPRPSLIVCRTHIGFGLPTKQGTAAAHGEPPGDEELNGAKVKLEWPIEPRFFLPEHSLNFFRESGCNSAQAYSDWQDLWASYQKSFPELAEEFERRFNLKLPEGWSNDLPEFPPDNKGMASRIASGKALNAMASRLPELIGGSADLEPSNKSWIDGSPDFQSGTHQGRNFHFGVREHAMGSIVNGMAYHGGVRPYGATFLVFSDYMRPAIRLSAISHIPSIWLFTHDSIGLGEDGPTHQPVEHLASLRAIPNLVVIRPADANEAVHAWRMAISRIDGPTALIMTRQNLPTLDRTLFAPANELEKGAYVLADLGDGNPDIVLMASGSEVNLIIKAGERLALKGVNVRLISFPSWELFSEQGVDYKDHVLPKHLPIRIAVEAGVSLGWERWVSDAGEIISLEQYGASAPGDVLFEKFGFTVEKIVNLAGKLLGK